MFANCLRAQLRISNTVSHSISTCFVTAPSPSYDCAGRPPLLSRMGSAILTAELDKGRVTRAPQEIPKSTLRANFWLPWVVFRALWLLSALSGCPWASLVFLLCSLRRSWVSSGFSGLFLVLVGPPPGPFGSLCLLWVSVSPVLF